MQETKAEITIDEQAYSENQEPEQADDRYKIVKEVLDQMAAKEATNKVSPVELAAKRAQDPYKTMSMRDIA